MAGVKTAFLVEDRKRAGVRETQKSRRGEGYSTQHQVEIVRQACARDTESRVRLLALARAGDADSIAELRRRFQCVIVPLKGGG
jgi:hypothetical protein